MSDESNNGAGSVTPEIEREARTMGWKPLEEFKGDPKSFIPADKYVERGRSFLPIVQAENRRLKAELDETRGKLGSLESSLKGATEAIEALKEYQSEHTKQAVERARADLRAQIRRAREEGDIDAELDAQEGIRKLDKAEAAADKKPAASGPPAREEPKVDPAFLEWKADNPWFETDPRKRGLALGIAESLRNDPANARLMGKAFFEKVSEEMETLLGERRQGKVDGGRPNGSGGSSSKSSGGASRSYDDLPADAKAACDRFEIRMVGKAFKDQAAWRKHYVAQYFQGE